MKLRLLVIGVLAPLTVLSAPADGQYNPRDRLQPRGLGVSPTFEGWFRNGDGSYTLSFGYFNRNTEETVTIPVGEDNFVSPGEPDRGQPTLFTPSRSYGVFTVTVPADFGTEDRVVWTLERNGERYAIPGGLLESYETANLHAPAIGMYPPFLRMRDGGAEAEGPNGEWIEETARVGEPLDLRVWSWDRDGHPVTVRFYRQRGPGEISFSPAEVEVAEGERVAHTSVTFTEPGEYVVYVRADHREREVREAGLEQCCWTNGYVSVTVLPE